MGGSVLVKGLRFRRVHEIQEANTCTTFRSEPDTQPSVYAMVVTNNQSCQCLHWFPSTARPDRNLHAWKDPNPENITHPNLPCPFMAETALVDGHGSVPGVRYGAGKFGN